MPPTRLVITLPGLLATSVDRDERSDARHAAAVTAAPAMPALARLLAVAGAPRHEPEGIEAALAAIYGVQRQRDWPLAAIRAAACGIDPGDDYWLTADPVTFLAGRADVRLAGPVTDLAAGDAAAIVATLNAHFSGDGLAFVAAAPAEWFVHTRAAPQLSTRCLDAAMHGALRECLPRGADAPRWRRWHDEIQMLLHEHPVNVARERRGLASANGIWFSQGGSQQRCGAGGVATWAAGGIALALAAHAGAAARPLPAVLDAASASAGDASTVVAALPAAIDRGAIDRDWLAPAWTALAQGTLSVVTLIADGDGHAAVWTAATPATWRRLALRLRPPEEGALLAAGRADEHAGE